MSARQRDVMRAIIEIMRTCTRDGHTVISQHLTTRTYECACGATCPVDAARWIEGRVVSA